MSRLLLFLQVEGEECDITNASATLISKSVYRLKYIGTHSPKLMTYSYVCMYIPNSGPYKYI